MFPEGITIALLNEKYANHMLEHLGIEYTEIGKDYLCGKMPVDHRTQQPYGLLHGGASVVLAESIGSMASNMCVDQEKYYCVGLEVNANHLKSATDGYVYCKSTAVHIGKKTHVWENRVTNEAGELISVGRLTVAVIERK